MLACATRMTPGRDVRVAVSDTGTGMDNETAIHAEIVGARQWNNRPGGGDSWRQGRSPRHYFIEGKVCSITVQCAVFRLMQAFEEFVNYLFLESKVQVDAIGLMKRTT